MMYPRTRLGTLLATTVLALNLSLAPALATDAVKLLITSATDGALTLATPQNAAVEQPMPDAITGKSGPDAVELAALYYYADQKQDDRVEREAARLRQKYPDFQIPADIYKPVTERAVDEQSLWALYEKNDFTGIDADIMARKTKQPDWQPSADFATKLARKKQRVMMEEATVAKDWQGVIAAAGGLDPKTETEIDLLWKLVDAYHETGDRTGMIPVYRALFLRSGDLALSDDAMLATLQKATRDFPASDIRAVIAKVAVSPGLKSKIAPVEQDLARKDVAEFNADDKQTSALPAETVGRLETLARSGNAANDHALLGWYFLKIKDPEAATDWFKQAVALDPAPNNAKGLYLALVQQGLDDDAWEVAKTNLKGLSDDPEFLMNALSVRFAKPDGSDIDADVVAAYSTTIMETMSADHAEILAWYAYNSRQFDAAFAWFSKSWDWEEAPARLKGLALSFQQLGKKTELAALKTRYAADYPDVWAAVKVAVPPKGRKAISVDTPKASVQVSYLKNFNAKNYSACISDLQSMEARGGLSNDAQLIRGWCYMGLKRMSEARAAFGVALNAGGQVGQDAAYGTALTQLASKLTDDAEALIAVYPLSAARDREIRSEIYWQRARSAFDRKQYKKVLEALDARFSLVAEPANLSQMRAWAHYHLGHVSEANAIFKRLSMHLSDSGVSRGLAVTSANSD